MSGGYEMKPISFLILIGMIAIFIVGCGGGKLQTTEEKQLSNLPDWYMDVPQDPNYLYAAATATSKDMQLAVDKAKQQARLDVESQLDIKMKNLTKKFDEEVGLNEDSELLASYIQASKSVVSATLQGLQVEKQEIMTEGALFRAYVLTQLPWGEARAGMLQKIKENQNLYTRFRTSQVFQELDREVGEYENLEKEPGQ
jgi:hypothetical protein